MGSNVRARFPCRRGRAVFFTACGLLAFSVNCFGACISYDYSGWGPPTYILACGDAPGAANSSCSSGIIGEFPSPMQLETSQTWVQYTTDSACSTPAYGFLPFDELPPGASIMVQDATGGHQANVLATSVNLGAVQGVPNTAWLALSPEGGLQIAEAVMLLWLTAWAVRQVIRVVRSG